MEPEKIRQASSDDISSMLALERECPTAAHWTEQQYRQLFSDREYKSERLVVVAEELIAGEAGPIEDSHPVANGATRVGQPLGFLVARHVDREWELENIVVAPSARRKGLGKRLLEALIERATQTNSQSVFLEVRESNARARSLYERAGFREAGRRKSYYASPLEDAIVYRRSLK